MKWTIKTNEESLKSIQTELKLKLLKFSLCTLFCFFGFGTYHLLYDHFSKRTGTREPEHTSEDTKSFVYKHERTQRSTKALKSTGGVGGCVLKVMIYDTKNYSFPSSPLQQRIGLLRLLYVFNICTMCVHESQTRPTPFH